MRPVSREQEVLRALTAWRDKTAEERGVPEYLILPNATIHAIARELPKTSEELLLVKGIKEAKLREYGAAILKIVNGVASSNEESNKSMRGIGTEDPTAVPVSRYLNALNQALAMTGETRVYGEVGRVEERGNAIYFTLKDSEDESVLSVFMWKNMYAISGVELEEGMVIIATGTAEIYKPTGRLSLRAEAVELVGEGALKAAYEKLKKELTTEGLFAKERKRSLPELPRRIGLITAKTGAVIHDFLNNLGKYGIHISFVDSRVEGAQAVRDLLIAMKRLQEEDIEVLVLVRGGGSHESLQAFNNEHVVRAIAGFPVPVICAIGHHEDIPLAQLAADIAPSTPTACAITINERWESALSEMEHAVQTALLLYQETLGIAREEIRKQEDAVARAITKLIHSVKDAETCVRNLVERFALALARTSTYLDALPLSLIQSFMSYVRATKKEVGDLARMVMARDPRRLLASGYAFALKDGKLLRSVRAVGIGDAFQVRVSDGRIDSTVTRTEPQEL